MDPIFSAGFDMPAPKQGGGMFGNADWKSALMAAVAGFMARRNPQMSSNMMDGLMLKQKQALEEAQYQRHRSDQNADWLSHEQWQRDNPAPGQPSEFEDALTQSGVQPGTPEWVKAMTTRRENMLDPVVMTPAGPMLRSQLLNGGQPAAPGVTFTPIGGPSPGGSGGFL